MNKKGLSSIELFQSIIFSFIFVILLGTFMYVFGIIDTSLSPNINVGAVNLSNASANTIGAINIGLINSADLLGILFIGGLILMVMLTGFMTREKTPPLFFMLEFMIVIFAYILAVYISNEWESLLAVLPFADLLIANAPKTTQLMLFLPRITLVTGFIAMLLTYAGIPRNKREDVVPGF